MADFNLSAQISLQLAQGAAQKLRDQIEKGFTSHLEIDAAKTKASAKKAADATQKSVKQNPIVVPVVFKSKDDPYESIKKKLKPLDIEVGFSKKSVKENLTNDKLQALLGKNPTVLIDVKFSPKTAKELKEAQQKVDRLVKAANKLQAQIDKASGVSGQSSAGNFKVTKDKSGSDAIDDLIKKTKTLSDLNRRVFGKSNAFGGGFFQFATDEIKGLITQLNKISGSKKGLQILKDKFSGLDDNAKGNLLGSLKTMFGTLTKLNDQEQKLIATSKKLGPAFDIKPQLAAITKARDEISKLFLSFASSDPSTFATSIGSEFSKASSSINDFTRSATRNLRDYDRLLASLKAKQESARVGKAGAATEKNIKDLISYVESKKGQDVDAIKSSDDFRNINALLGSLKFVDIAAQRAETSITSLIRKASLPSIKNSSGAGLTGLKAKTAAIGRDAGIKIAGSTDPQEIQRIKDAASQDAGEATKLAIGVDRQIQRLRKSIIDLQAAGYDKAAKSLKGYGKEFSKLVKSGASIQDIDAFLSKKIAEVGNTNKLDNKIDKTIARIEKLKYALQGSGVKDASGIGNQIKDFETNLKSRTGEFSDVSLKNIDEKTAAKFYDIKAGQKFNEQLDATASKLRHIGKFSDNLGIEEIYTKKAKEFEYSARAIGSSSDRLGVKLQKLKSLSENVLAQAKFDSEGGFFGSISKSAGLAAKRLGAFLVLAQGLYTVQSFFTSALSEAVKVDREFVKLEQVFNKDFSGSKLVTSLTKVKTQIYELGRTLGVSTLEVASAAQILAQAGIYGRDLEKLLGTISKSQLGPSFGSASETAEASIAIFRQFNLTAEKTQEALGGINRLSAKFAVEAKGITEAVRRAGGVFSASGDDIGSFSSAFTLVKQKTREADEAIATGLRNIAQRLQTSTIQEKIRNLLGINLVEDGAFIGFEESISKIGKALKGLNVTSQQPLFAQVREAVGGVRQGGRVNPLLEDYEQFESLTKEFKKGAKSIDEDVATAYQSIENKIARAKSAVIELYTEILRSDFVKFLVEGFTQITLFATRMLKVLNSLPGALLAIGAAAKVLGQSKFVTQTFLGQIAPRVAAPFFKNKGGVAEYNKGSYGGISGLIPGGGPNKDSILAYLTTGEYVLQRKAVKKYGTTFLDNLNDGVITANSGGPIKRNGGGIIPGFVNGGLADKVKSFIPSSINNVFKNFFAQKPFKPQNLDISDLQKDLKSLGVTVVDLNKYVEKYIDYTEIPNSGGSFNPKTKTIGLPNRSIQELPHELGHALETNLSPDKKALIRKSLTRKNLKNTRKVLKEFPNLYADKKGNISQKTVEDEAVARQIDALIQFKQQPFSKQQKSPIFRQVSSFRRVLEKAGVDIKFDSEEKAKAKSLNVINDIRTQGPGRGYGDPLSTGSGQTKTRLTADQIDKKWLRANYEFRHSDGLLSRATARLPNLSSIQKFSPFSGKSFVPKGLPGAKVANQLGAAFPTGKILEFGKSVATSKSGLAGLAATLFLINTKMGDFGGGLTELIASVASATFSMYSLAKINSVANFAKNQAGIGAKNLIADRGKKIAEKFATVNQSRVAASTAKKVQELRNAASFFPPSSRVSLDAAARARVAAQSVGDFRSKDRTASIFENIRGSAAGNAQKAIADNRGFASNLKGAAVGGAVRIKSQTAIFNAGLANQTSLLQKGLTRFSGGLKSINFGAVTKGLNIAAIAVGAFIGATNFFINGLEKAAAEEAANAKTVEQAKAAGVKGRLAEGLKLPTKALGSTAAGALTGAAIGSFILPGFGTVAGAIGGGIVGLLATFKDDLLEGLGNVLPKSITESFSGFGLLIKDQADSLFEAISNQLYIAKQNISNGSSNKDIVTGAKDLLSFASPGAYIGNLIGDKLSGRKKDTYGDKRLALAQADDVRKFKVRNLANNFSDRGKGSDAQGRIGRDDLSQLNVSGRYASELLNKGKIQAKGSGLGGGFSDLAQETQDEIKSEIQSIADVYNAAGPTNRKIILESYAQTGVDIKALAKEVGIEIDAAGKDMSTAFDELSLFFARMSQAVELSSARLSGLEGGLETFKNPSQANFAPDQLFDILKSGIDPSKLGLGDQLKFGSIRANSLANAFDPRLAEAANFEIKGRRAARNTAVAVTNSNVTLNKKDESSLTDFLSKAFTEANGGDGQLSGLFETFLRSKGDQTGELIDGDNKINSVKVNDLFKEFADSLGTGALEEIKRINSISKQFADEYKSQIAQRFSLENEIIGLLQSNVDKRKQIYDIENKAKGLTGDKLAAAQGRQAKSSDASRLGAVLTGTGLGGNASVQQLKSGLIASQYRVANAGAIAQKQVGAQGPAAVVKREAEIQAIEEANQNKYKAGLQLIANGTDTAAHAMAEFERASQKAASSSKFLSDALLGSDDQMHQTILGIQAMAQVQNAFNKGGVDAARQALYNLGEDARTALNARVGQSEEYQAQFNNAVGISSDISASPEAAAAKAAATQQIDANNALIAGINTNVNLLTSNTEKMKEFYAAQFENTQKIVNQANESAKALVGQIAALPDVIKMDANVTVNIVGSAGLKDLEAGIGAFVEKKIRAHLDDNNNKLVENNAGLNRP